MRCATKRNVARALKAGRFGRVPKAGEKSFRADVPAPILDKFLAEIEDIGLPQKVAVARLMKFYLDLPDDVRPMVLRMLTPTMTRRLSKMILRHFSK